MQYKEVIEQSYTGSWSGGRGEVNRNGPNFAGPVMSIDAQYSTGFSRNNIERAQPGDKASLTQQSALRRRNHPHKLVPGAAGKPHAARR